eukprot:582011-Hanusia_phi.AAC.1
MMGRRPRVRSDPGPAGADGTSDPTVYPVTVGFQVSSPLSPSLSRVQYGAGLSEAPGPEWQYRTVPGTRI